MGNHHEQLGKESIPKTLFKQSMPAIIGLLVVSLYNLVDTIFIGRGVGSLGIAGLAITFPIQMIAMAISQTIGIGSASIISRSIGAKKFNVAEKTLGNLFSLVLIVGSALTVIGLAFLTPILKIFGATKTILPYATDYMTIIIYGSILLLFAFSANNLIRAEGNAKFSMIVMALSAVLNIILDAIFIFGFDMGMKGAALATVIAQGSSALLVLFYFLIGKSSIKFYWKNMLLDFKIVMETFSIGVSSFARMAAASVMSIFLNHSLAFYGGDIAIAAMGVVNRLFSIIFLPIIGLVIGMQPIVGYNYGAKNYKRTKSSINLSVKVSTLISIASFVILMAFAEPIVKVFTNDLELIALSVRITKIVILAMPIIGFQIIAGGMYQSMGKAKKAFVLSILRQVIFLIPLILIMPLFFKLDGLFYAFPMADFLAGAITAMILMRELKNLHKT
ncbi:MATE family efflux transporter [Candidatus Woesearchaeota archaeon]|nr:MATE family efflux transporter [Candidatus Woesearchaeota archaeon]